MAHHWVLVLALGASVLIGAPAALAQKAPPPGLQPVPEPPPLPRPESANVEPQPEVVSVRRGEDTVEEYRIGGKLYMMKVTPAHGGVPYYLIDHRGDGVFSRQQTLDNGLRPPMWVLFRF